MIKMVLSGIGGGIVLLILSRILINSDGNAVGMVIAVLSIVVFVLALVGGGGLGGGCLGVIIVAIGASILAAVVHAIPVWCSIAIGVVAGSVPWILKLKKETATKKKLLEDEERELILKQQNEADEWRRKKEERQLKDKEDRQKYARDFNQGNLPRAIERCRNNKQLSESWDLNPTYEAVALQRDVWCAINEASLKINTNAEKFLGEYKKELDALQEQARADMARLEEIEEEMREEVIDCGIVVGEYKNSVDAVFSEVDNLKNSVGEEITQEQKIKYEKQLSNLISLSDREVGNQKKLAATDGHYLKYSELLGKQKDAVFAVNGVLSKIDGLREKIAALLGRIDAITKKYADAVSDLENGNYAAARNLLGAS
jgi:hypothetical protein